MPDTLPLAMLLALGSTDALVARMLCIGDRTRGGLQDCLRLARATALRGEELLPPEYVSARWCGSCSGATEP